MNSSAVTAADADRQEYISPTKGLGGKVKGALDLQGIGGRHLVFEEMHQHKLRMKKVKAVIDLSPPWSHTAGGDSRRPNSTTQKLRASVAATRPPSAAARDSRPASALGHRTAPQNSVTPAPAAIDVKLDDTDRETYATMLEMLCRKPSADCRSILERLYRESEDRKLLSGYTGVFPKLRSEHE